MSTRSPERPLRIIDQEPKLLTGNSRFYPGEANEIIFSWYADSIRGRFIPAVRGSLVWRETGEGREYYVKVNEEESYSGTHPFAMPMQVMEHIMKKREEIDDPNIPLKLDSIGTFTGMAQRSIQIAESLGKPVEFEFNGFPVSATPGSTVKQLDDEWDRLHREHIEAILKKDPDYFNRQYREANGIPEPQPTT